MTLARFFFQRATRLVARTCYWLFFQEILKINPGWAPWHVHVQRQLSVVDPTLDGAPSSSVVQKATHNVRQMKRGVLVGGTLDFSASLAGGLCNALEDVGFDVFSVDEHARSILFGCKAYAHRVCDWAPVTVRATLRELLECYNIEEAERLRALVIQQELTRDCAGVLGKRRLLPAFCTAFSNADQLQREVASSTTKAEESQHERIYKLCGRQQPIMVSRTSSEFVDQRDADELDSGRAAGAYTSIERADSSQGRREKRRWESEQQEMHPSAGSGVDGEVRAENPTGSPDVGAGDECGGGRESDGGMPAGGEDNPTPPPLAAASSQQPKRRRRAGRGATPSITVANVRIAELEWQLLEQRNKALEAEISALRTVCAPASWGSAGTGGPLDRRAVAQAPHHRPGLLT